MKKHLHIGCSSFNNLYWKKIFYPEDIPRSAWFEYYCTYFDTYEMNGTFYKFPSVKTMQNWYRKAPGNFLFSVKVSKEITHIKKLIGCEILLEDFYAICKEGLQEKLGCVLFQFPPSYQYTHEKLLAIIKLVNLKYNNVIEFRHQSWWIPEVWNELSKNNITFCSVSYPQLPETVFTDFPLLYIRLHGKSKLFYSSYSTEELTAIRNLISYNGKIKKAFIYFNNTAAPAGILNALEMKSLNQPQ